MGKGRARPNPKMRQAARAATAATHESRMREIVGEHSDYRVLKFYIARRKIADVAEHRRQKNVFFFARKRKEARHAASARSSGNSPNYDALGRGLEPGRLRPEEPTPFGRAAPAKERPFLATERDKAHHAASAPSSASSLSLLATLWRRALHANRQCHPNRSRLQAAGDGPDGWMSPSRFPHSQHLSSSSTRPSSSNLQWCQSQ